MALNWCRNGRHRKINDAVPVIAKEDALALKAALADGSCHALTGPINKSDCSALLAECKLAENSTLTGIHFYVEGIEGDISRQVALSLTYRKYPPLRRHFYCSLCKVFSPKTIVHQTCPPFEILVGRE